MNKTWSGKTGGSKWQQLFLLRVFKHVDPVWMYPIMWLWVIGYIITRRNERQAVWYYWTQRRHETGVHAAYHFWLSYINFGKAVLDRFACWAGRSMNIRIDGEELWNSYLVHPQPLIIIGSHIGNIELTGYLVQMPKDVYALVYLGDTELVVEQREKLFNQHGLHIIPVQRDGGHVLDMHKALSDGYILSILGDRLLLGSRAMMMPLLGEEAPFPEGTYRMAVAEQVPVLSMYVMREGHNRYTIYVRQLSDGTYTATNHKQQAEELLGRYVEVMEEMLDRYPHQWFNFYSFWQQ
ncbi:MAG: hypothetical protein MJZ79_02440 [Paludibacteraceae bacterium]|nr:hypothetical protein [Paludibacteraceae bacterium]